MKKIIQFYSISNFLGFATIFITLLIVVSCKRIKTFSITDESITKFHEIYNADTKLIESKVNLYVDYSTCVKEATLSSGFFAQIRPRLTGLNPTLYGIKGELIEEISSDKDIVNQELNKIDEINFANLEGAFNQICCGNNQAILITDGEYWTKGVGERTDLAYIKDSFIKWLNQGNEVYIFIEPYIERIAGAKFSKKRFYFLFTNDDLKDNIYSEINKAFSNTAIVEDINLVKLSNTDAIIEEHFNINENLTSNVISAGNHSSFEIYDSWKVLEKFILYAKNPDDGNLVQGGDYLLRGLILKSDRTSLYKYSELDVIVYNISEPFLNNIIFDQKKYLVNDLLIIDNELFRKSGEIGLKISENYQNALSDTIENLLRVDIIAKATEKKHLSNVFEWNSITKNNEANRSVNESIMQTIDNNLIDPSLNKRVLYTLYLKTCALK